MPTAEKASILELPPGAPVMHVVHTARDEDGDILDSALLLDLIAPG
jgi:GntR family transcriptional regulator